MNQQLTAEKIAELEATASVIPMTRRDKLLRWATLVRNYQGVLYLFHRLEYYATAELDRMQIKEWAEYSGRSSAFGLAAADPILVDAGAKIESVGDAMRFMELTQAEMHEFSCDCGGAITNTDMADRIEKLAG